MPDVIYDSMFFHELYKEITRYPERFPELQDENGYISDSEALDYAVETYDALKDYIFDRDGIKGKTIVCCGIGPDGCSSIGIVGLDSLLSGVHSTDYFAFGVHDNELYITGTVGVSKFGYMIRVLNDTEVADKWLFSLIDEVCKFVKSDGNYIEHTSSIMPYVRRI